MAEPLSALPGTTSSNAAKAQAIPRPLVRARLPELPETSSTRSPTEKLVVRLRSGLERSYREVSRAMVDTWDRSRRNFRYISQEHPLRIVVGVALAAFITGAALRIWRSNHD
jgi:hypothetical protein